MHKTRRGRNTQCAIYNQHQNNQHLHVHIIYCRIQITNMLIIRLTIGNTCSNIQQIKPLKGDERKMTGKENEGLQFQNLAKYYKDHANNFISHKRRIMFDHVWANSCVSRARKCFASQQLTKSGIRFLSHPLEIVILASLTYLLESFITAVVVPISILHLFQNHQPPSPTCFQGWAVQTLEVGNFYPGKLTPLLDHPWLGL